MDGMEDEMPPGVTSSNDGPPDNQSFAMQNDFPMRNAADPGKFDNKINDNQSFNGPAQAQNMGDFPPKSGSPGMGGQGDDFRSGMSGPVPERRSLSNPPRLPGFDRPTDDLAPPGIGDDAPPGLERDNNLRRERGGGDDEFGSHPMQDEGESWEARERERERDRDRRSREFDNRRGGSPGNFRGGWRGPPPNINRGGGGFNNRGNFNNRGGGGFNRGVPDFRARGVPPRGFRGGPPMGFDNGTPRWGGPQMGGPMAAAPANPMFTDMEGEVWIEYKNDQGRPYYYNCKTQKTVWTKPKLKEEAGPNPLMGGMMGGMPRPGMPPMGGAIPRFPGIPPFNNQDTMSMGPRSIGPNATTPPIQESDPKKIWTEHKTEAGKVYYYNSITKLSVWERPPEMDNPEKASTPDPSPSPNKNQPKITIPGIPDSIAPAIMAARAAAAALAANLNTGEPEQREVPNIQTQLNKQENIKEEETPIMKMEEAADVQMDESSSEEETKEPPVEKKKEVDANKPVAINSVIGTPWCVVWTGDGRSFFYNAVSKESHWVMPDDLKDNEQVEKLLKQPPKAKTKDNAPPADEPPAKKKPKLEKQPKKPDGIIINTSSNSAPANPPSSEVETTETAAAAAAPTGTAKFDKNKMTVEERQAEFRAMLLDREVSAFSTWDKELHKIVFDPRYLLLSGRERKQAYEAFIKSRAEDERIEKRNKIKDNREAFKKLIDKSGLSSRSTFSDFAQKYGKDPKFKAIEKMKEREHLFNEWKSEQSERKESERKEEKESTPVKETEDNTERSREKGERKRQHSRDRKDSKDSKRSIKENFIEMLKNGDTRINAESNWSKKKKYFSDDERYIAVGSSSLREEYFYEYAKSKVEELSESEKKAIAKKEREAAALKKREGEVAKKQVDQSREWERERGVHAREEAQQHFLALLQDMVRDADASWRKTRKQLREDSRWELAHLIDADQKEKLFTEHIETLSNKRKRSYRKLLDECEHVTLTSTWRDIRKKIKHDARFSKFSEDDKEREAEYLRYIKEKVATAKSDFRQLLKEIKCVSHKSKETLRGPNGDSHMREIRQFLTNDKRGLVLDDLPEDRDRILDEYLTELEKFGPPPPPTATRPAKR